MLKHTIMFLVPVFITLVTPIGAHAAIEDELRSMREQIQQLEKRVQQNELNNTSANRPAATAENTFNPAISLILSGTYGSIEQNPDVPITGFALSPNNHGHSRSFSLGESELGISANIDPQFRGVATIALAPEGGSSVENAYVQTSALGHGFNLKMGRFFSGLGYLNELHAHAWDFIDQPLVYRTMWDNQTGEDGLQLKWLAPSDTYVEIGAELGHGRGYPGSDRKDYNGAGSATTYAHIGDDVGISNSWRAGVSLHQTRRVDATSDAFSVTNSFNGDSLTRGADFVWKYAPDGNTQKNTIKFQAEYFQRRETGLLTYDTKGTPVTDSYSVTRSGWYMQGIYQFMPHWRLGLRYDQLDSGNAAVGTALTKVPASYAFIPVRYSLMTDYSASEFSRIRVQAVQDNSRTDLSDNQLFVQYIMSLGAHGAHQF